MSVLLIALWGAVAFVILFWSVNDARGWAEQAAGATVALLWPIVTAILLAVMLFDWQAARRTKALRLRSGQGRIL